jgi:hypothetical protein
MFEDFKNGLHIHLLNKQLKLVLFSNASRSRWLVDPLAKCRLQNKVVLRQQANSV